MKTFFLQVMAICAMVFSANAQFEMGAQASFLTGHGKNDNHTSLVGAVVFGRYEITDNMAVGSVIHMYNPKTTRYSNGKVSYSAIDNVTNVSGTFDFLLGKKESLVQPYLGVDLGLSTSTHNIEFVNELKETQKYNIRSNYIMISPKLGVNIGLANGFGIYSQVQYNYSPGNGGPVDVTLYNAKTVYGINTEPISKYFNIDTGVYLTLGKIKQIL